MPAVSVEVPQVFKPVLKTFEESQNILFADTSSNSKIYQVLLAYAVSECCNRPCRVGVYINDMESISYHLKSWMKILNTKHVQGTYTFSNGSTIWVGKEKPPFSSFNLAIVCNALEYRRESPCKEIAERLIFCGPLVDSHHWFYSYVVGEKPPIKITFEQIIKEWPDTEPSFQESDPIYERFVELKDVAIDPKRFHFSPFAKQRLFIRSDKPVDTFSKIQREYAQDQLSLSAKIIPFDLTQLQKRYLAHKRRARILKKKPWFILLKYRRGGFTTLEQGSSYQTCVCSPNSYVATLAHSKESTQRIFRMVTTYHEKDPFAPPRTNDSLQSLELSNGSYFFLGTAGGSGFSRGETLQRVHGSEVAFWDPDRTDLDLLHAAIIGATDNGEIVYESTPNGRNFFHNLYVGAKSGENEFTPIFLPWFVDPRNTASEGTYSEEEILDTLTEEEKEVITLYNLNFQQVAFRRAKKKQYGIYYAQEMPEDDISCFLTSGICFFDVDRLLTVKKELDKLHQKPLVKKYLGGLYIEWEAPKKGEKYVLGADTSEGIAGCDKSGFGILNKTTGEQVASLHGYFPPPDLAELIKKYAVRYNNALCGVERQNHGHAVLENLKRNGYGRSHLQGGKLYFFKSDRPGWSTDSTSRPIMLDSLSEAVEDGGLKIRDELFVDECLSFRRQNNGKFQADNGSYDDCVMKWAIAWQMRNYRATKPRITVAQSVEDAYKPANRVTSGSAGLSEKVIPVDLSGQELPKIVLSQRGK